jgi:membrane-associated phospholipid phosphatase
MRRFRPGAGAWGAGAPLLAFFIVIPFDATLHDLTFRYVNSHGTRLFANGVTQLGTAWAGTGLLGALAAVGYRTADAGLVRASLGGLAGVALGSAVGHMLKQAVCRGRPTLLDGWGVGPLPRAMPAPAGRAAAHRFFRWPCFRDSLHHSFPSGHAITAFAVAAALSTAVPARRGLWLSVGVLVGGSRVLLNAHFVSDVVGGAFVGWWAARLGAVLADRAVHVWPVGEAVQSEDAREARLPTR